ncbi:MAG: MBL fold metallo-hydrolase [Coriobacteriales bacterium]|nr:MBL fold metallo-hydrolase [Coriobacteriales bacterium]
MKVTVLGSAGWIPVRGATSCVLVENGDDLFILDAGTGVANLFSERKTLERHDTVYLLLSHYHLDHLIGLIYLDPLMHGKHLRILGPGRMSYDHSTKELVDALLRREFFSRPISEFSCDARCLDFPGTEFTLGATKVSLRRQTHSAPSYRITLDDKLVYATDTTCPREAWEGVRGELLLHECWDIQSEQDYRHTTLWQIEHNIAPKSFGHIALLHQNPEWSDANYEQIQARLAHTNIQLAHDGMTFEL